MVAKPYSSPSCKECKRLKEANDLADRKLAEFEEKNRAETDWEYQEQFNTLKLKAREAAAAFLGHKTLRHSGKDCSMSRK